MNKSRDLLELESRIGYKFENAELLRTALTHSSYANEQGDGEAESNERLEFLGDAVIGLGVALLIFDKGPHLDEGKMTELRATLVRSEALAGLARSLELGEYIQLGVGADRTDIRENSAVLEDAFEAMVAAVFLDGGVETARQLIRRLFETAVEEELLCFYDGGLNLDYKSRLQMELQRNGAADIRYKLLREIGPDHDKRFSVAVVSKGKVLGTGEGKTKKYAEKMAAKKALEELKCI